MSTKNFFSREFWKDVPLINNILTIQPCAVFGKRARLAFIIGWVIPYIVTAYFNPDQNNFSFSILYWFGFICMFVAVCQAKKICCPLRGEFIGPIPQPDEQGNQPQKLRPMSEAPKDGTRVLLYDKGFATVDCWDSFCKRWQFCKLESDRSFDGWLPLPEVEK